MGSRPSRGRRPARRQKGNRGHRLWTQGPCICTTGLGQRVRTVRRAYGLREKDLPQPVAGIQLLRHALSRPAARAGRLDCPDDAQAERLEAGVRRRAAAVGHLTTRSPRTRSRCPGWRDDAFGSRGLSGVLSQRRRLDHRGRGRPAIPLPRERYSWVGGRRLFAAHNLEVDGHRVLAVGPRDRKRGIAQAGSVECPTVRRRER